jgi:hypothetical protein
MTDNIRPSNAVSKSVSVSDIDVLDINLVD